MEKKELYELFVEEGVAVEVYPSRSQFRHQFDPLYVPYPGEYNFDASMTIPDQSMSVSEIMRRYAQGLPLAGERVPIYEDEDDENVIPDMTGWDLADKEAFMDSAKLEIEEVKEKLAIQQKADEESKKAKKPKKDPKVLETPPTEDDQSSEEQPG